MHLALLADQHRPAVLGPADLLQPIPTSYRSPGRLLALIDHFAEHRGELADLVEIGTPERTPLDERTLGSLTDELPVDYVGGRPQSGIGLILLSAGSGLDGRPSDRVFGLTWVDGERAAGPWLVTLEEARDLAELQLQLAYEGGGAYEGPAFDPSRDIDGDIARSLSVHSAHETWILVEPLPEVAKRNDLDGGAPLAVRVPGVGNLRGLGSTDTSR